LQRHRRLLVVLATASMSGCPCNRSPTSGDAVILGDISLVGNPALDCIWLTIREQRSDAQPQVQASVVRSLGVTEYKIAVYQGSLPNEVVLQAFGTLGVACSGSLPAASITVSSNIAQAGFQIGQTNVVPLNLQAFPESDGGSDAGQDAGANAGRESGALDSGPDSGAVDSGSDSGPAAADAGPDAGSPPDAGADGGPPGPDAGFSLTWDLIPSPETQGVPFPVTLTAKDSSGNTVTGFAGTAALVVAPPNGNTLTCSSGCSDATDTGPFASGIWTGTVSVGGPPVRSVQLQATASVAGATASTSNVFELLGPIMLVQDVINQAGNVTSIQTMFPGNVTAGDVLVATITSNGPASIASVSGGGVSDWTQAVTNKITNEEVLWIYYGKSVGGGGTKSVQISGTSQNWALEVSEWSGLYGAVDDSASSSGSGTNGQATSGVVTTGNQNDLIIALETDFSGTAPTSGPTNSFVALMSGTLNQPHNPAYLVVSAQGNYSTRWTFNTQGGDAFGALIAAFY
jgi:hypothetical protein